MQDRHLDFAIKFLEIHAEKLMPIQMEEVLQIFLVARSDYQRLLQVNAAMTCLRRFRYEARLLTRGLLVIAAVCRELPNPDDDIPVIAAAMDVWPDDRRLQGDGSPRSRSQRWGVTAAKCAVLK